MKSKRSKMTAVSFLGNLRRLILKALLSVFLRVLPLFIKREAKMILFASYNGKSTGDSPGAIFEALRADPAYADYQLVWALKKPRPVAGAEVVRFNSLAYYKALTKAKYWVFNAKMAPYYYKAEDQVYLQTWHGTPLKRLAHDIEDTGKRYRAYLTHKQMVKSYAEDSRHWDWLIASSPFTVDKFASAFQFPPDKMIQMPYPRTDILYQPKPEQIEQLKAHYQLPLDKKVILYAPTWRDDAYGLDGYHMRLQLDFAHWKAVLGEQYVVLFKPHYLISNHIRIDEELKDFIYPLPATLDIHEAYLMADVLVTDYSSVFFDYAILKRPIYFYMYDLELYSQHLRGFYLDVHKDLPSTPIQTEKELLAALLENNFDYALLADFNQRFNPWVQGSSSLKIIEKIFKECKES